MLEALKQFDHNLFLLVNGKFSTSFLDMFFGYITNLHLQWMFWVLFLPLVFFWIYKKRRRALIGMAHILIVAGLSDLFCYHVIKQFTYRDRPNNSDEVASVLKVGYGPKSSSFPSNHASTSFAMAYAVKMVAPIAKWPVYIVAVMVAYSRPYVGVHFPSDIMAGMIIGTLISMLYFRIINRFKILRT